eukprot:TRINITY_DN8691_c0_g1_i1.p1 TRINITY_DN8691_c0_g1~~TRINITY_DN8691_c0_g1_i1.p1  ORF type:complete len:458 (-),score=71.24 TRINITY_DN8691_c0_g1_i1:114-1487(-)
MLLLTLLVNIVAAFLASTVDPDQCSVFDLTKYNYKSSSFTPNTLSLQERECLCELIPYNEIIVSKTLNQMCFSDLAVVLDSTKSYLLTTGIGIAMVILNGIIGAILGYLAEFRRFRSLSEERSSRITFDFIAQFINSAIVPMVAYANINGFIPSIYIAKMLLPSLLNDSNQDPNKFPSDFNRNWHLSVGSKFMSLMMINIFSPYLTNILLIPIRRCYRGWRLSSAKPTIQKDLNELVKYPEYNLAYESLLTFFFLCLIFSPGMPMILVFLSFALFFLYWSEKITLLRYSSRPPAYDNKINSRVANILPFAILLHCLSAILMYSNSNIFPIGEVPDYLTKYGGSSTLQDLKNSSLEQKSDLIARVLKTYPFVILFVLTLAAIIYNFFLVHVLKGICRVLCCKKGEDDSENVENSFGTFQVEYEKLQYFGLCTYDIKRNDKYKAVIEAIESALSPRRSP